MNVDVTRLPKVVTGYGLPLDMGDFCHKDELALPVANNSRLSSGVLGAFWKLLTDEQRMAVSALHLLDKNTDADLLMQTLAHDNQNEADHVAR